MQPMQPMQPEVSQIAFRPFGNMVEESNLFSEESHLWIRVVQGLLIYMFG